MRPIVFLDTEDDQLTRHCGVCGTAFHVRYPSEKKRFCSRSCGVKSHAQRTNSGPMNSRWAGGKTKHYLYDTYMDMRARCSRPSHHAYARYGGRGITVCDRWESDFWAFVADMGERPDGHSIDRIDNDGNYSPDNCRWSSSHDQNMNRRAYPIDWRSTDGRFTAKGTAR